MNDSSEFVSTIEKLIGNKNYCTFEWKINFFRCICDYEDTLLIISSPKIVMSPISASFCLLRLFVSKNNVFLHLLTNAKEEQFSDVVLKLSVQNKNSKKCYNCVYSNFNTLKTHLRAFSGDSVYILNFLQFSDINNCAPNGELTIVAEVLKSKETLSVPKTTSMLSLQLDMKNFQQSEKLSDITLLVGDQKFHVHKAILASRSSLFLAMFDNKIKEKEVNEVVIENVSGQVIKQMLNYIYTDVVDEDNFKDLVDEVLPVAHSHAIQGLVNTCEVALIESLNINNVFKHLLAADFYKLNLLKKAAVDFISSNEKDFVESDEFKNFISSTNQRRLKDLDLALS